VPFLSLDGFPPGNSQTDFVAACHKDVAMVRKDIFPDRDAISLFFPRRWELVEEVEQLAEMRLMKRMLQSKDIVGRAATLP